MRHGCVVIFSLLCHSVIFAQLKADFTASVTSGCVPLLVQFTDASTGGTPSSWQWVFGNGNTSTQQNPGVFYKNPGTYTVKLRVANASGQDSVTKVGFITVYANPVVNFQYSPSSGCLPLSVQFTDESTDDTTQLAKWAWDFGDGQVSSAQSPNHTYITVGNFSVSLTATSKFGCSAFLQKQSIISANGVAGANFTYSYANACSPPTTVTFNNSTPSNSSINYQWYFGDGGASTNQNPVYTYTSNGTFQIQLIATTNTGCQDTVIKTISIGTVTPNFTMPSGSCANKKVYFYDSSMPTPISVEWYFGDGTQASGAVVGHAYTASGSYPVKLVANFGDCADSITKIFSVANKPSAGFTSSGNRNSCQLPGIVQFQNTSAGALYYKWNFGDGQTSTQTNPSHTYTKAGFYNVTLIAINSNGCSDTLSAQDYVQLGPPRIDSLVNFPYLGCVPASVNLTAAVSSGDPVTGYMWGFGDGQTSTQTNPTHTYINAGTYTVKLKVTTATGCTGSATFTRAVVVGNKPTAKFTASPTSSCASVPIQFTNESSGAITNWYWTFGDGGNSSQQNPLYKYTDTGYFSVTLAVVSNGCVDSTQLTNFIYINPPIAKFGIVFQCGQKLTTNFVDSSIAATAWNWDFGDGQKSTKQNTQHTYKKAGTYYVTLVVTNGTCSDTKTDTLTIINQNPFFTFSPPNTAVCKYDTIAFTARNYDVSSLVSLYWNFGDGTSTQFFSNTPVANHEYKNTGIFKPYLVVQDNTGCNDTIIKPGLQITVMGPHASFTNTTGACLPGTITFTDKSIPDSLYPIVKWIWNFGDGSIDTLSSLPFIHKYNSAGSFTVKLKVIDNYGCFDSISKYNADTIANPVAAFALPDSISCLGSLVNFVDSSNGISLSYNWSFGDGATSNQTAPQHQYKKLGKYTVALGVTDKFGCTDSITKKNYVIIANPKAQFTITDSFAKCPPLIIKPINTSKAYSFLTWDFGDGNTSNLPNPIHTYAAAGVYRLKLTAQGFGSCFDTTSKQIVLQGPSGNLTYLPVTLCSNNTVKFIAGGNNIAGYSWNFGDGGTAVTTDSTFNYVYATPGHFLPTVVIIDPSRNCQVTLQNAGDSIDVGGVTAGFMPQTSPGCDSALVSFTDSSVILFDGLASRVWNFGDGTTTSLPNPIHYYRSTGIETISLKIVTNFGCTSTYTLPVQVTVNPAPIVNATIPPSVCVNSQANFSAANGSMPAGAITWLWQFGDGGISSQQDTFYTYNTANTYTVAVTATNEFGCTDSVHGTIIAKPLPPINAGPDSIICLGQSVLLHATGANTYVWVNNATLSCTNCAGPIATPDSTSTYYVTGTSVAGCSVSDSVQITVERPITLQLTPVDTLCTGFSIQLTASGADQYNWQPSTGLSNPNIANPTASPLSTITYSVIGTDIKKCFFDTASAVINVFANPAVSIVDTNVTIIAGSSYLPSSVTSPDVVKWQWLPLSGVSCANCAQPTLSPGQTTRYTETVFNKYGCSAADFITVKVLCDNQSLYIPNTFSPNGDGMNDYFYPRGKGLYTIKSMRIFNRWGRPVFEMLNFAANDMTKAWDGTYKGQPVPSDVYVYVIEVICINGTVLTSKGNITLLR